MRLWKSVGVTISLVDGESLHALYALQRIETIQRDPRCTRHKRKHLRALLAVEGFQSTPPPDNDVIRRRIAVVIRRCSPFVYIDVWSSGDEKLNLLFIELHDVSNMWVESDVTSL